MRAAIDQAWEGALRSRARLAAFAAAAASVLCGCPSPSTYTTPRTLRAGDIQLQLVGEGMGGSYSSTTSAPGGARISSQTQSTGSLAGPTVGVRIGAREGFEVGARLANLSSLAFDGKVRLQKGDLDLALDPGFQIYPSLNGSLNQGYIAMLQLPLLVGWNLARDVTVVVSPGLAGAFDTSASAASGTFLNDGISALATSTGMFARMGGGFDLRVGSRLALHPEITGLTQLSEPHTVMYTLGLALNIGAQPDTSDLAR